MLHCTLHVVHTWCNTAPSTVWSLCGYVNISCSQASSGQVLSQVPQVVAKIIKGKKPATECTLEVHNPDFNMFLFLPTASHVLYS